MTKRWYDRVPKRCPYCRAAMPWNMGSPIILLLLGVQSHCGACDLTLRNRCSALETNPW